MKWMIKLFIVIFAWSLYASDVTPLLLTEEEQTWLDNHKNSIRYASVKYYPPLEFVDSNGKLIGLTQDYIHLLEKKIRYFHTTGAV